MTKCRIRKVVFQESFPKMERYFDNISTAASRGVRLVCARKSSISFLVVPVINGYTRRHERNFNVLGFNQQPVLSYEIFTIIETLILEQYRSIPFRDRKSFKARVGGTFVLFFANKNNFLEAWRKERKQFDLETFDSVVEYQYVHLQNIGKLNPKMRLHCVNCVMSFIVENESVGLQSAEICSLGCDKANWMNFGAMEKKRPCKWQLVGENIRRRFLTRTSSPFRFLLGSTSSIDQVKVTHALCPLQYGATCSIWTLYQIACWAFENHESESEAVSLQETIQHMPSFRAHMQQKKEAEAAKRYARQEAKKAMSQMSQRSRPRGRPKKKRYKKRH